MDNQKYIEELRQVIIAGDDEVASTVAQVAIDAGINPQELIKEAINKPMEEVGRNFQAGDIFLPELIMIGDAARAASDIIVPNISVDEAESSMFGTVVIGTIQGDMHDIGKNIVAAYLTASGFKIKDLGTDVPPKEFIRAAEEEKASVIAISTLLSTTQPLFANMIKTLVDSGKREKFYVIVGGGPVTPEWAAAIGADGYGRDAADAADLTRQILEKGIPSPLSEPLVIGALK